MLDGPCGFERVGVDGVAFDIELRIGEASGTGFHQDPVGILRDVQVIHIDVGIFDEDDGSTAALLAAVGIVAGKGRTLDLKGGKDTGTSTVGSHRCSIVATAINAQLKGGFGEGGRRKVNGDDV